MIIWTQGEDKLPEEALSLYKFITFKKSPKINNLYYSIFSLRNVSYDLFYQSGKNFDKIFKELRGKSLLAQFN